MATWQKSFRYIIGFILRIKPHQLMKGVRIMRKAAGVIAIISGGIGLLAAVIVMLSLFAESMDADSLAPLFMLGLGALFFALAALTLGVVIINSKSNVPGILLIVLSIVGASFSINTLPVALFMTLPCIGGVLAVLSTKQAV
jgi:hypothetical protein